MHLGVRYVEKACAGIRPTDPPATRALTHTHTRQTVQRAQINKYNFMQVPAAITD